MPACGRQALCSMRLAFHRGLRWKSGNAKSAVISMIREKVILMLMYPPTLLFKNFQMTGPVLCAAPPKICLRRFKNFGLRN